MVNSSKKKIKRRKKLSQPHPKSNIGKGLIATLFIVFLLLFPSVATPLVTYTATVTISILSNDSYYFYVDNNTSDLDSSADKGTQSNFTAQQYGPDLITDVLTEENTGDSSDTLLLYVNTIDWRVEDWMAYGFPYEEVLNAIDYSDPVNFGYIWENSKSDLMGDFFFTDSGKSTETIINATVQIYGRAGGDALEVFLWDGSSYTSLGQQTLSASWSWVNYEVPAGVLNTWAKIDGAKIYLKSIAKGPYEVDCGRLEVNYNTPTNYEIDLEEQWTDVDFDEANEELCIYGGSMDAENINVDVWDGDSWENLFTDLDSGWNNVTVSSYLTASTFTIRFKGSNETGDSNQDSWNIDTALLHVWS